MNITGIEPRHIAQFAAIFNKKTEETEETEKETTEIHRDDNETINIPEGESWVIYENAGWNVWHGPAQVLNVQAYIVLPKV